MLGYSIILYLIIGWLFVVVPFMLVIIVFIQNAIVNKLKVIDFERMKIADQRGKKIKDIIHGIKMIKFNTWERVLTHQIKVLREQERQLISSYFLWEGTARSIGYFLPLSSGIVCFWVYINFIGDLSIADTYAMLILFNNLLHPIIVALDALANLASSQISDKRVSRLLKIIPHKAETNNSSLQKGEIEILDAIINWVDDEINGPLPPPQELQLLRENSSDSPDQFRLGPISMRIKPGEFFGIIGRVGTGKSSLILSLISELQPVKGSISRNGSLAYVSQEPFLLNDTLRENILFGDEFEEAFYEEVIKKCELLQDIQQLPGGDLTQIGERGINLSGGQKQRIAIARAAYSRAEIVVIDDSLSALDSHVGERILENVFMGLMSKSTRIMSTHKTSAFKCFDRIIWLQNNGKVGFIGRYQELVTGEYGFEDYLYTQQQENIDEDERLIEEEKAEPLKEQISEQKPFVTNDVAIKNVGNLTDAARTEKGKLNLAEKRNKGNISSSVYLFYFKEAGICLVILIAIFYSLTIGIRMFIDWWTGQWIDNTFSMNQNIYPVFYLGFTFLLLFVLIIRAYIFGRAVSSATFNIFDEFMWNLLRRPISFFDTTPTGVLLNRSIKDVGEVDYNLPKWYIGFLEYAFVYLGTFILISIVTPYAIIIIVILSIIGFIRAKKYIQVSTELKRISKLANSPVISAVNELVNGIATIRSFGKIEHAKRRFEKLNDLLTVCEVHEKLSIPWLRLVIEYSIFFIIAISVVFITISRDYTIIPINDPGVFGLVLSYLLTLSNLSGMFITNLTQIMKDMSSVERIQEYVKYDKHEADFDTPIPPKDWPSSGKIVLENISTRYREGLPLIIDDVSFEISPCEKIGIVGRTGSGKSTILLTLMRILELSNGKILIGDLDISKIGLSHVRKAIDIIPQDPQLLEGTIMFNLDPMEENTSEEVLARLEELDLIETLATILQKEFISKEEMRSELNRFRIDSRGENLSLGQRQLICICRALIKRPKILLMDESTASIDQKTDEIIQSIIHSKLGNTTVVTIAHRLNTIMNYDRILVLDNGKKIESGRVTELLSMSTGVFRGMASK